MGRGRVDGPAQGGVAMADRTEVERAKALLKVEKQIAKTEAILRELMAKREELVASISA